MIIRKALMLDAKRIHELINVQAKTGEMLTRSISSIYEMLRGFYVVEEDQQIVGCCAFAITWEDLAEVKSLVIDSQFQGKGFGRELINTGLNDLKSLGVKKVFGLTYQLEFFKKMGFREITKEELPHKIWTECINCSKFPNCDEIAVLKELS